MGRFRGFPVGSAAVQLVLLGVLCRATDVSATGVAVAFGCVLVGWALLARGLEGERRRPGPADQVSVTRATLACVVAGLTVQSLLAPPQVPDHGRPTALVLLAGVALVLDAVDGWLARRTRTVTPLGARMDLEVDAFLILVLSVAASAVLGWWVLMIGVFRYAFLVATWVAPWLGGAVPPRWSRKAVAALQGIVLTVVTARVLPGAVAGAGTLVALGLLAWSFGTQVVELWPARRPRPRAGQPGLRRLLRLAATVVAVGACVAGWVVLVAPDDVIGRPVDWLGRLPLEPVLFLAVLLVLPARWRSPLAVASGLLLGVLTALKLLDVAFTSALRRPFNVVTDWTSLRDALGLVDASSGRIASTAAVIGVGLLVVSLLGGFPLSVRHVVRGLAPRLERHRPRWAVALLALTTAWLVAAAARAEVAPGLSLAATPSVGLAADHVGQVRTAVRDRAVFAAEVARDAYATTPASDLLSGLRGKDVLVVFVESYGEVAVTGSPESAGVSTTLDEGASQLAAAGYATRSAWLDSPTFGGISWLAHSTLQSGVWVDSQHRYDQLVATNRLTLSGAFKRAGWRTVGDVPANRDDWPQGRSFYRYDQLYDATDVGYAGPAFGYATMPDQYTLKAFADRELTPGARRPVMAEIDLVTSHLPWAPLPTMVDWSAVGDGSVYGPIRDRARTRAQTWADPASVRAAYGASISYSLQSLVSFVRSVHDDNLVLVLLGDHQPSTVVSGPDASHRVPVTIVSHDDVTQQIVGWGWQQGMRPGPAAPTWRMDAFRDRFLGAFTRTAGTPVRLDH